VQESQIETVIKTRFYYIFCCRKELDLCNLYPVCYWKYL